MKKIKKIITFYKERNKWKKLYKKSTVRNLDFRSCMYIEDILKRCDEKPTKEDLISIGFKVWINYQARKENKK